MSRPFVLGVVIVIVSLTGCTSLQDNNNRTELNIYEGLHTSAKEIKEDFIDPPSIEKGYSEEIIVEEVSSQLKDGVAANVVTQSVEASDFVLEVTTSTVIRKGWTLKVKGILKYIGDENVKLSHGGPIIRFSFTGSNESRAYKDLGYVTKLEPGQTFKVEDEFKVTKTGKHKLTVRTTTLEVNRALIEGVGNERYLNENKVGHNLELEKSRLSMHPIEIQVK